MQIEIVRIVQMFTQFFMKNALLFQMLLMYI